MVERIIERVPVFIDNALEEPKTPVQAPIISTLIGAARIFIESGRRLGEPEVQQSGQPEAKKELTPVKETVPEKINGEINKSPSNVNFPVNFSGTGPLKKLPQKMKFKGKPGRQRTEAQVEELLTFAQARGVFPNGISDQMQRYYRREYPEYFRKGRKRKKVQTGGPAPLNFPVRRSGTDV